MATEPGIRRARWQLWAVTIAIMGALAGGIVILSAAPWNDEAAPILLPSRLLLATGLVGIVAAFSVYAMDRERRLDALHERLMHERIEAEQMVDRLRTLDELARERDTNAALLDASADGIAVVDPQGRIARFNRAMAALTGITHERALGRIAEEVLRFAADDDDGLGEHPVRVVLADGQARAGWELRLVDGNGGARWVSATLSPVSADAAGPGPVLVCLRDITDRKEQERSQRDFVSMAAHELRSPLTAIKGFARTLLLKGDRLQPERREVYLSMINDQSDRLARLVEDLMQVAHIDAGRVALEPEDLDVAVVARSLIEQFGDGWKDRSISVSSTGGFPVAFADPHRIEEILINLIDNAIKYSPAGTPVDIEVHAGDDEVAVSVRDRGVGIAPEDAENLFRKFVRIPGDATADVPGTGLGLYIVRGLIEAHGGRIWVESAPGEGSTFTFTLPLVPAPVATGTTGP